ncbi:HAD family hydrolase [Echinicola pacifica]|nr:HAD family hydrolase [Echinicola pacifica]
MKIHFLPVIIALIFSACQGTPSDVPTAEEPSSNPKITGQTMRLASWQAEPRQKILTWLNRVTDDQSSDFVPVNDRIAVFDNDGTLWPEQPFPNQLVFTIDMLKAQWKDHPEWAKNKIYSDLVNGNMEVLKSMGMKELVALLQDTHNSRTEDEFNASVRNWADTATNKKFERRYIDLVYQPMLELLDVLREHDFETFIVSGGGADFMRVWAEEKYGIPPYQVIGSYGEVKYEVVDGKPVLSKVPGNLYIDDKGGKPQAIHRFIGKKPIFAAGNSDGDQAMLQYTSSSNYRSFCMLLRHTDAEREFAYEKHTASGHLETALVEADEKGWLVVDMKNDFKQVFPAK